ncbi:MAG: hypothetical protein JSR58_05205 [Verrucomicrobia bacterium]|nr:hypothetical protein [Verrucomicrobiota bacterium]
MNSAFLSWQNGHLFGLFDPKMRANSTLWAICCAFVIKNPQKSDHFSYELKTELT